jgi:molybdate transport system regulatory protein
MLLDRMNQAFSEPVVTAAPGGAGGGGASLTPLGAEVLERYQQVATQVAETAHENIAALARRAR